MSLPYRRRRQVKLLSLAFDPKMTNCPDFNQTLASSLQSGDEQSSDDDIKTLDSSSAEQADIDTTLASPRYSSSNLAAIYNELLLIRTRLAEENERLKKKADLLNQWEERMRTTIEQGFQAHKEKYEVEVNGYKEKINTLTKDFKRTNDALQVLREQNTELKRNLTEMKENHEKLIEKNKQTEKRAENLLRLNQIAEQKIKTLEKTIETTTKKGNATMNGEEVVKTTEIPPTVAQSLDTSSEPSANSPNPSGTSETRSFPHSNLCLGTKMPSIASTDSLIFLFNWLSDGAQNALIDWPSSSSSLTSDTLERYSKLITILADQTSFCLSRNQPSLTLAFLKLVYFSLITIESPTNNGQIRHLYSCSYRRLCEQILKCDKNQVRSMKMKMKFLRRVFSSFEGTTASVR